MSAIAIITPWAWQLFQRNGTVADIPITGTYTFASACHIEASFNGGTYQRIATVSSGTGAAYSGTLTSQAQGQGTLTVRIEEDHATSATQATVGIGELIATMGQSNMDGRYTNNQPWSSTDGFTLVQYYGDLGNPSFPWYIYALSSAGDQSFLGRLGTLLMNTLHVPVAFLPGPAVGGTSWAQWQPGADHLDTATLYGHLNKRIVDCGVTPRICIGWEGESDANSGTSQAATKALVETFVSSLWADRGVPTMLCQLQICPAVSSDTLTQAINAAIAQVWADNTHAVTGPNFHDQTAEDGSYHFISDSAATTIVAPRWFTAFNNYLDVVMPTNGRFVVTRAT